jgi:hypothetical protein
VIGHTVQCDLLADSLMSGRQRLKLTPMRRSSDEGVRVIFSTRARAPAPHERVISSVPRSLWSWCRTMGCRCTCGMLALPMLALAWGR